MKPVSRHSAALRAREADDVESPFHPIGVHHQALRRNCEPKGECEMMRRNEIRTNDKTVHDGCGDGGERFHIAGLPGWLRDRIESVAIPADRDQYFRDVVAALAGRGWDSFRITIAIAGRVWIPERYAGHLEEWGIKPVIAAQAWVPLRSIDEAAPGDVAASDLRAVQRAIASGRWRENSQAKKWAGHAVAAAMKLDVETHKAKIVALLKTWIGNGALVGVEGEDEQRKKLSFVEVGFVAE